MTVDLSTGETKFAETYDEFLEYKDEYTEYCDHVRRLLMSGAEASGRRCGVLGDPIAHSLSPVLHRAAYAALGLDWSYDAHRVAAGGLEPFVAGLDASWRGLSLTMPLKREALALADRVTDRARLAGAVNTLLLEGDERVGDNTDLPGAVAAIRERTSLRWRRPRSSAAARRPPRSVSRWSTWA